MYVYYIFIVFLFIYLYRRINRTQKDVKNLHYRRFPSGSNRVYMYVWHVCMCMYVYVYVKTQCSLIYRVQNALGNIFDRITTRAVVESFEFCAYLPITASSPASEATAAAKLSTSALQSSRRKISGCGSARPSV